MIGTINCVYETPCGYCSKFDKKCDRCYDASGYKEKTKQDEINHIERVLNGYGISMVDNNGNYRPTNEVMIDVCRKLREMREYKHCHREEYELHKQIIYKTLV